MPSYVITGPDGKKYRVSGQGSPEEALAAVKRQAGASMAPAAPQKSGSILPISSTPDGGWQFDSNAGVVGAIKRGITLPGDVYTGKVQMNDPETGRTSNEVISRAGEMAATVTPVSPAMRAGERAVAGAANSLRRPKIEPPSAEALKKAAGEGYDAARSMGVRYKSDAVSGLSGSIKTELEQDGILAELAPKTFKILDALGSPPADSDAPLEGLLAARRALKNARLDFNNPTEKLAAERIIRRLDEFLAAPPEEAVLAGPAAAVGKTIGDANANYAASKRSELLTGKLDQADRQAARSNSGLNTDNAVRQRADSVLNSPKQKTGLSAEEQAALEGVVKGGPGRNAARYTGNLLGGGGGLGAIVTGGMLGGGGGAALGSPSLGAAVGVGAAVTGSASKQIANALARKSMQNVDKMTRRRSPLYQQMLEDAPMVAPSPEKQAALIRAIMLMQQNRENRR
jgi:hypothetical protein